MRALPAFLVSVLGIVALGACATSPAQQAASDQCRQFALSGGYPFLQGGPTYGPNSGMEKLPGAPPLMLGGPGQDDITAHLDEEQYLQSWCQRNMTGASR
jgi:hypothetical protein